MPGSAPLKWQLVRKLTVAAEGAHNFARLVGGPVLTGRIRASQIVPGDASQATNLFRGRRDYLLGRWFNAGFQRKP